MRKLTEYEKLSAAVFRRDAIIAISIFLFIFSLLISYTIGRVQGWDRGSAFTEKNIEVALTQAVKDGHDFSIHGMSLRFYPRKDGGVIVANGMPQ